MSITNEIKEKLILEAVLHAAIINKFGFTWNDEWQVYIYPEFGSPFLAWEDFEQISFEPFDYDGDRIDAVLFFGDSTIEFHFENSQEAINWTEVPNEIIRRVIDLIPNGVSSINL